MNDKLTTFQNQDYGNVRVVTHDGEPWFIAADVCRALGLGNVTGALRKLDDDEKALISNKGHSGQRGGTQTLNVINEPGLYTLVLGSRKPEAKAFKRWITHEVIPSIRKTGGYIAGEETLSDDELMARALQVAHRKLRQREQRIQQLSEENSGLLAENMMLQPKAAYFDELVSRNLLTSFRDTAKEFGIKERVFIDWLLEKKYIYRDKKGNLTPTAGKGDGLFEVKESYNPRTQWIGVQTLITPKGRETFLRLTQGLQ